MQEVRLHEARQQIGEAKKHERLLSPALSDDLATMASVPLDDIPLISCLLCASWPYKVCALLIFSDTLCSRACSCRQIFLRPRNCFALVSLLI
ncbi:hypothetical protein C8Q74DRAFT_1249383, partial [Fomes fomentarius]